VSFVTCPATYLISCSAPAVVSITMGTVWIQRLRLIPLCVPAGSVLSVRSVRRAGID